MAAARARFAGGALLAAGAFAVSLARAQEEHAKGGVDDVNPRAPTTPLKIELAPYYCTQCVKEKLIPEEQRTINLYRAPVANLVARLEIDEKEWMAVQTPHFVIFSTLQDTNVKYSDSVFARFDLERLKPLKMKVQFGPEGAKVDAHARLHLYQVRLERLYAHFSALTNNTKPNLGMPTPYEIYLFRDYTQHHAFVDTYFGRGQDKGGLQHHDREMPNFILFTTAESVISERFGKGDGSLANHVMHNGAHVLIDGYNNYYRETPAWLEEGLGHYYERRENIRINNFCCSEGKPPTEFIKPDWETTIFSIVRRDKDPPLVQWCEKKQPGEMTGIENGLSWGIVRWMVETEPIRFTKMLEPMDDLKLNLSSAQLVDQAFGVSVSVLYQRWRDYVLQEWAGR